MGAIAEFIGKTGNTTWIIYSKKDQRWNCSGDGGEQAVQNKLKELAELLGERPDDLEMSAYLNN